MIHGCWYANRLYLNSNQPIVRWIFRLFTLLDTYQLQLVSLSGLCDWKYPLSTWFPQLSWLLLGHLQRDILLGLRANNCSNKDDSLAHSTSDQIRFRAKYTDLVRKPVRPLSDSNEFRLIEFLVLFSIEIFVSDLDEYKIRSVANHDTSTYHHCSRLPADEPTTHSKYRFVSFYSYPSIRIFAIQCGPLLQAIIRSVVRFIIPKTHITHLR